MTLYSNLLLKFDIPCELVPNGIRTNNFIPKKNLSREEVNRIYISKNRENTLAQLDVSALPKTNAATLILKKTYENYFFITSFPGQTAMPIPDNKMNSDLFILCQNFGKIMFFYI